MTEELKLFLKKYIHITEAEREQDCAAGEIRGSVDALCGKVENFLRASAKFVRTYQVWCGGCFSIDPSGRLLLNGVPETKKFSDADYSRVADECAGVVTATAKAPQKDAAHIREFCRSYNTLLLLLQVRQSLIDLAVKNQVRRIGEAAAAERAELENCKDPQLCEIAELLKNNNAEKLTELLQKDSATVYAPGNLVIGRKPSGLYAGAREFFDRAGISPAVLDDPVCLRAEKGKNAVFIRVEDEKQTGELLKNFLPGLFEGVAASYAPGGFSFAFVEKGNVTDRSCGKFCNRIESSDKDTIRSGDTDSCLYKALDKRNEYGRHKINGIAVSDDEVEVLIDSISGELLRRKSMNQLDGQSLAEYNRENPYEMLPYFVLVINTFSNLFGDYRADKLYAPICDLIANGGEYGIFVICVGKSTAVAPRETSFDEKDATPCFDLLPAFGGNVIDLRNGEGEISLLQNTAGDEELFAQWRAKCAQHSSMLLDTVIRRNDIEIPPFNNKNGAIHIPIGIADGKVCYFRISSNKASSEGASTILTGGTGSGKSTFIRTLIMSGAAFYSPDQLQFYIIDFKTKSGTADFFCFSQDKGSAYIPHVRFLSERSTPRQALSLLNYINHIYQERTQLFTRYSTAGEQIKDAVSYRDLLYREMKAQGCGTSYPAYAQKVGKDAMPALPQIYLIIDEANSVFTGENFEVTQKLGECARIIRSHGISIILSGQSNPLATKKDIQSNFQNRIALATKESGVFEQTFPEDSANYKALGEGFSFLGGRQGKAVLQSGMSQKLIFANTAYLSDDMLAPFAARVNEKYPEEIYHWLQMRPGSHSAVSADVLVDMLNDPGSDINRREAEKNTLPVYIGVSSLSSLPCPVLFGGADDEAAQGDQIQRNNDPHNYCMYAEVVEKQIRTAWNMALYLAYCLKKNRVSSPMPSISINYLPVEETDGFSRKVENEGEKLTRRYARLAADSGFEGQIRANGTVTEIADALQECYALFRQRKGPPRSAGGFPYLFCLVNANQWLANIPQDEDEEEPADAAPIPPGFLEELHRFLTGTAGWSEEDYATDFLPPERQDLDRNITFTLGAEPDGEELLNRYRKLRSGKTGRFPKLTAETALKQLRELLLEGAEHQIYVVFAYSSVSDRLDDDIHFVRVTRWKNLITDFDRTKGEKYDENVCYCKGEEIRLWDFLNSEKWVGFANQTEGEN